MGQGKTADAVKGEVNRRSRRKAGVSSKDGIGGIEGRIDVKEDVKEDRVENGKEDGIDIKDA